MFYLSQLLYAQIKKRLQNQSSVLFFGVGLFGIFRQLKGRPQQIACGKVSKIAFSHQRQTSGLTTAQSTKFSAVNEV